jgi:hypothetical protein
VQEVVSSIRMAGVLRATPATFGLAGTFTTRASASAVDRRIPTASACPLSVKSASNLLQTSIHGGLHRFSSAKTSDMMSFCRAVGGFPRGLVASWKEKKSGFSRRRGVVMNLSQIPEARGLYDPAMDKDSCGVGFVAELTSKPTRKTVGAHSSTSAHHYLCCRSS